MRTLEPKMIAYLDAKLAGNGLAQHAIELKDARTVFRLAMEACVGIREKTGNNDGPMVQLIQETIGRAEGEPWCMALVQTCVGYAELKTGLVSPLFESEHCMTVWRNTPRIQRVQSVPALGAIIVWNHAGGDSGHTGCTIGPVKDGLFAAVEGNTEKGQSATGQVVREGGGCYATRRSMDGAGSMKLVGFIKPF